MMSSRCDLPEPTFVDVGDVTIATYVLTPQTGSATADVVLCHGTPWSSQVWAQVAHSLADGRRIFLWDMPGYGRSTQDGGVPMDLNVQMFRFARLLEHWELTRPWVVAHDIGGAVALGAHLLHHRDYESLFLWDIVTLEPWGSEFFRLVADHSAVFEALPPSLHSAVVAEYIAGASHHRLSPNTVALLSDPWLTRTGQRAFYQQISHLRPEHTRPLEQLLHRVRCPTRIGWGEDDPWIPVAQATRLQELLPGAPEVITMPGVGHLAPLEDPLAVWHELVTWLTTGHDPDHCGRASIRD